MCKHGRYSIAVCVCGGGGRGAVAVWAGERKVACCDDDWAWCALVAAESDEPTATQRDAGHHMAGESTRQLGVGREALRVGVGWGEEGAASVCGHGGGECLWTVDRGANWGMLVTMYNAR